jgi:hypothetical protein
MTQFKEGDLVTTICFDYGVQIGIFLRTSSATPTGNVAEIYIDGEVDVYHKDWLKLVQKAGSSGII